MLISILVSNVVILKEFKCYFTQSIVKLNRGTVRQ